MGQRLRLQSPQLSSSDSAVLGVLLEIGEPEPGPSIAEGKHVNMDVHLPLVLGRSGSRGTSSFVLVAFCATLGGAGLAAVKFLPGKVFVVVFNFGLELKTRPAIKK